MYCVGVDWADDHHDIYIIDNSAKKISSFRVDHSPLGITELLTNLSELSPDKKDIVIAIEKPNGILVNDLLMAGYQVYSINPKAVARYRDRYKVSGAKSDDFDAMVLANILRTDRDRFRPLCFSSELMRELGILVKDQKELIETKTQISNMITSCLKEYYPLPLKLFSKLDQDLTIAFLEKYPTPQKADQLSKSNLDTFLKKQHYNRPSKLDELYATIQTENFLVDEITARAKSRLMNALLIQLQEIRKQLKLYEQEITRLFEEHPDHDIFNSLPGVGPKIGPRLMSCLGEDRNQYDNFSAVQCEAGTAPITRSSGNYRCVSIRRACQKFFRNSLYDFAFTSLTNSEWAREYYDEQRARGKTHPMALRALSNKWVKIIYTMWVKRTLYNESLHQLNRLKSHKLVAA